jgi:hypothetical protein
MKVVRVGNSYRRSFQGGPRHVLLGLVPGALDPAEAPVVALPQRGTCDHGPLDSAKVHSAVVQALSQFEAETGHRVQLSAIEYVPNDSPYYEMYYGHALAIAHVIANDEGVAVLNPKALVDRVVAVVPALSALLGKHRSDNSELLPHVFFGDVTRFVVSGFADHPEHREDAEKILAVLEGAMHSPSEDVQNLVSVSFCENLLGEKPLEAIRAAMGSRLRAELAKYEGA